MPTADPRALRSAAQRAIDAARRRRRTLPPLPEAVIAAILADGNPTPTDPLPGQRMPPLQDDPGIYAILK